MGPKIKLKVRAIDFDIALSDLIYLPVLEADLHAVQKLAYKVKWLAFIAQSIWVTTGKIYFCTDSETPEDETDTSNWRALEIDDVLRAGYYEFRKDPGQTATPFTRIEHKSDTSATNDSQSDRSRAFRRIICVRDDNRCVVTGILELLTASHIVPKRLGDAMTREIFQGRGHYRDALDRWSPENGVLLYGTADRLFDHFLGSFYPTTRQDVFAFHSFDPNRQQPIAFTDDFRFMVHQKQCRLTSRSDIPAPPSGILAWHYAQAAVKAFATVTFRQSTRNYQIIDFREETGSTDDTDYTDDINDSILVKIDHARYTAAVKAHDTEKALSVEQWLENTTITPEVHGSL